MEYVRPLYLSKPTANAQTLPAKVRKVGYGLPDEPNYYYGYPNECYEPIPFKDEVDLADERWERQLKRIDRYLRKPSTLCTIMRNFARYKIAADKDRVAPVTPTPRYVAMQLRRVDENGLVLFPWHMELIAREKIAYMQATGKDNHLNSTGQSELHDIVNWTDQEFENRHSYMMRMGSFQIVSYPKLRLWQPTADPCHDLIRHPQARKPEAEDGTDGSVKGGVSAPRPGGGAVPY